MRELQLRQWQTLSIATSLPLAAKLVLLVTVRMGTPSLDPMDAAIPWAGEGWGPGIRLTVSPGNPGWFLVVNLLALK